MDFIPYGRQFIDDDDIAAVISALKSDYLTSGKRVVEFENDLAKTVDARYAVGVSSGTAALHIAMLALGIMPGDEVITSPITFAASANCILYCGAKPVFADIDKDNMLVDIDKVEKLITNKTKAIIPVHYGGELCNMDAYDGLAREYRLALIQDSAHSLGGIVCDKKQGEYSGMQIWSFHPVKTITTGEGGAVTTNDEELYKKLLRLRSHGITRDATQFTNENQGGWYYEMLDLGYNYRLTDIQCALGISQLKKLNGFAARRAEIVAQYDKAFADLPLDVQISPKWSNPVRHLYTVRLHDKTNRKEVYDRLVAKGIGVNVHYIPVHLLPYYRRLGYEPGICPIAEDVYERLVTLPLHPKLTEKQVLYVIDSVRKVME